VARGGAQGVVQSRTTGCDNRGDRPVLVEAVERSLEALGAVAEAVALQRGGGVAWDLMRRAG
jgi:hypothetical protein